MPKLIYHDSDTIDKAIVLGAEPILIGRATECQIQTQDAMVSRRHARIIWDGAYIIEDLGSSNGVYIGHEKVQRAQIRPGDVVTCGSLVLKLMPDTAAGRGLTQEQRAQIQAPPPAYAAPPPMAPPPMAPPPMAPPPMAPPPPARSMAPPPMAPPPMAPPPMAPPPMAPPAPGRSVTAPAPPPGAPPFSTTRGLPPPVAPPPAVAVGPNAILRGQVAPSSAPPVAAPGGDARLAAELESEKRRRADAEEALLRAEERARAAESHASELETAAREGDRHKRRVDQLTAELRRMRGGKDPEPAADATDEHSADRAARMQAEAEVERLRLRISGLETELASAGAGAAAAAGDSAESARLRRQVDQMTSELKRLRAGQPADAAADAGRIAELTAELRRAEADRDAARAAAAARAPAAAAVDPAAADAAVALSDSLAELRSSLRAAVDEAAMLTAPSESVTVVGDALRSATEQLEGARTNLRNLGKLLGVA